MRINKDKSILLIVFVILMAIIFVAKTVSAQTPSQEPKILYQDRQYKIIYQPQAHNYLIVILQKGFGEIRTIAEAKFLALLKVNKDEVCEFKVSIVTPYSVNPVESLTTKGLSFCQGFQKPGKTKFRSTDLNGDGVTNTLDYSLILINYRKTPIDERADINADGKVNALDASIVLGAL